MMPLALQSPAPGVMKLSDEELQFIEAVREGFVADIGGPNQDPNDPAYRQRWQVAQQNADHSLRGMLGRRRYQEYEVQVESALQTAPQ